MSFNFAPPKGSGKKSRVKFFVGIASRPSKQPNEPSTLFSPTEIRTLCDEHSQFRRDHPEQCIGLVKEHEDDSYGGQFIIPFATDDHALGVIGRLDSDTPYGGQLIRDVETGNRVGLSLKTHTVLDIEKDKLAEHGIHHLGIVKHPCWKEMTWITQTADDFNGIMQAFKDKWVDAGRVGYMSEHDRNIFENFWGQKQWPDFDQQGESENPQIFSRSNPMQAYSRLQPKDVRYENSFSEGIPEKVTVTMADTTANKLAAAENPEQQTPQVKKTAPLPNQSLPAAAAAPKKMSTPPPASQPPAANGAPPAKQPARLPIGTPSPGQLRDPRGKFARPPAKQQQQQDNDVEMGEEGEEANDEILVVTPEGTADVDGNPVDAPIEGAEDITAGMDDNVDGQMETEEDVNGEQEAPVDEARKTPGVKRGNTEMFAKDGNNSSSVASKQGLPAAKRQKRDELSGEEKKIADTLKMPHDRYKDYINFAAQFEKHPELGDATAEEAAAALVRERQRVAQEKADAAAKKKKELETSQAEYKRLALQLQTPELSPHVPADALDFVKRAATNPSSLLKNPLEPLRLFNLIDTSTASLRAENQKKQEAKFQQKRERAAMDKQRASVRWAEQRVNEQVKKVAFADQQQQSGVRYATHSPALEQQRNQRAKVGSALAANKKPIAPSPVAAATPPQQGSGTGRYQNVKRPSDNRYGQPVPQYDQAQGRYSTHTAMASAEEITEGLKPGYAGMNALQMWTSVASADGDNEENYDEDGMRVDGNGAEDDGGSDETLPPEIHDSMVNLGNLFGLLHGDNVNGGFAGLKAYATAPKAGAINRGNARSFLFPKKFEDKGSFNTSSKVFGRPVMGTLSAEEEPIWGKSHVVDLQRRVNIAGY